jgi:hypothetical protein
MEAALMRAGRERRPKPPSLSVGLWRTGTARLMLRGAWPRARQPLTVKRRAVIAWVMVKGNPFAAGNMVLDDRVRPTSRLCRRYEPAERSVHPPSEFSVVGSQDPRTEPGRHVAPPLFAFHTVLPRVLSTVSRSGHEERGDRYGAIFRGSKRRRPAPTPSSQPPSPLRRGRRSPGPPRSFPLPLRRGARGQGIGVGAGRRLLCS